MLVKRHKRTPEPPSPPKLNANEVAARVGGYTGRAVLNKSGAFGGLTRYRLAPGGRPLFSVDEVDALISQMNANGEAD